MTRAPGGVLYINQHYFIQHKVGVKRNLLLLWAVAHVQTCCVLWFRSLHLVTASPSVSHGRASLVPDHGLLQPPAWGETHLYRSGIWWCLGRELRERPPVVSTWTP